jgi:23S rRNA pseudouridine1911/1915/1917 synthase
MTVAVELTAPAPLRAEPEDLPLTIVHEDEDVLVVDKAAGVVVHAGPGHSRGALVNAVLHHLGIGAEGLPVLPGNDALRPGVVHRIDRDTSGLVVFAKHAAAQEILARQFRTHALERTYLGVVRGVPPWERLREDTLHGRDPRERRRFSPLHGRRRAVTELERLRVLAGAALIRFRLETGRTHQIRMHCAHVAHPILGDRLYGGTLPGSLRERLGAVDRHLLHAATLGFVAPSGAVLRFASPLPKDFEQVLAALELP